MLRSPTVSTILRYSKSTCYNLGCFDFYPAITNEEELGLYFVDECGAIQIPDNIAPYFDYESYGRDMYLDSYGGFTDSGYIIDNGGSCEVYDGMNIPDEYRVFAHISGHEIPQ